MAQSHSDFDIPEELREHQSKLMDRLIEKAEKMTKEGANKTSYGPNEKAIEVATGPWLIRQLPEDPDAIRISIGETNEAIAICGSAYISFRGNPQDVREVLERALEAFKVADFEGIPW